MSSSRIVLSLALLLAALPVACATAETRAVWLDGEPVPEGMAAREVALEALYLDGLDTRVTRLSSLGEVVTQSLRQAAMREAEEGQLSLRSRQRLAEVRRAAFDVYREGLLRRALVEHVADREGHERLPEVLAFQRSPRARLAASKRERVASSSGQKALALFLGERAKKPPDEVRLRLIKGLLEASREAELMEVLSYDASATFLGALEGELEGELGAGFQRWREEETGRSTFAQQIQKSLLLQTYFALIELSRDELTALASFWQSPAGRWWADTRIESSKAVLEERAEAFVEELRLRPQDPPPAPSAALR